MSILTIYRVGILSSETQNRRIQVIGVAEIDQQALVAFPDLAWHRIRAKRELPEDGLTRAIRGEVRAASELDRSVAEEHSQKIWLGFLKPELVDCVVFGSEGLPEDLTFPTNALGITTYPYAQALAAVAQDHFAFQSAESVAAGKEDPEEVEDRLVRLETGMMDLISTMRELTAEQKAAKVPRPHVPAQAASLPPRDPARRSVPPPPGLDPQVVQQALQAGVSWQALQEIGNVMKKQQNKAAGVKPEELAPQLSSDEDERDEHLGDASGVQDPVGRAVMDLSSIVKEMRAEKKQKKDKGLEAILDRAESGSQREAAGSSRSKASALGSLQRLLITDPKLI